MVVLPMAMAAGAARRPSIMVGPPAARTLTLAGGAPVLVSDDAPRPAMLDWR
ncbi:hypothetical protein [Burkholderia sp. LMU1-1-1.1]|uniref:hypothetical protein n=1 Tax=Burkholderia sp. LMU1-1-1.1 TaxID=3135266 RepID=UPI00342AE86F